MPYVLCLRLSLLQKLFQAVEEARALLAEGAAYEVYKQQQEQAKQQKDAAGTPAGTSRATRRQQQLVQQQEQERAMAKAKAGEQMLQYPPPVREDLSRHPKLLLKWLKAAAVEPEVCGVRSGAVQHFVTAFTGTAW